MIFVAIKYQELDRLVVEQTSQIEKLQQLNATQRKALENKTKEGEGLQNELTRLEIENDQLQQTCVRRSDVVFVDDIPTRSMRVYCRKMAEAWKYVLPIIKKLGTDLGDN
jgi:hypothetical protein